MATAPAALLSYTLQPAGAGGVARVLCSDGSVWYVASPLLSLAGATRAVARY